MSDLQPLRSEKQNASWSIHLTQVTLQVPSEHYPLDSSGLTTELLPEVSPCPHPRQLRLFRTSIHPYWLMGSWGRREAFFMPKNWVSLGICYIVVSLLKDAWVRNKCMWPAQHLSRTPWPVSALKARNPWRNEIISIINKLSTDYLYSIEWVYELLVCSELFWMTLICVCMWPVHK